MRNRAVLLRRFGCWSTVSRGYGRASLRPLQLNHSKVRRADTWRTTVHHAYFSTDDASTPSWQNDADATTGEACYERALHAMEQAKLEQEQAEAQRSKEQFEAWQKAQQQSTTRPTKKGVAVTKTIAKQARQARKTTSDWEDKARFWMEKAALEHFHAKALVQLGNDALDKAELSTTEEHKVQEMVDKALQFYEMAGENGSAVGWFNLGQLLWTGYPNREGIEVVDETEVCIKLPEKKKSLEAFFKAIELGDRDAMFFVGVQLISEDEDTGIEYSSPAERCQAGLDLIEQAGSLDHGGALYYLSLLYLNGHEELAIAPCAPEEFVSRLDSAANAGDSDALFLRGHCFYHGDDGYKQDYTQALENFLAAAEAGHTDAAVSAGAMLHQGSGVQRDQRRAFELYQLAGELGNVEGWRNVVACYALGEGVPQSKEMAEYIAKTVLRDD